MERISSGLAVVLVLLGASRILADDWPQWLGPKRDGVWRENGIVEKFPASGLKQRWRVPIGGGYAGPAVAQGRVIVTDRQLGKGEVNPSNPFDKKTVIRGVERVLCLDEKSGAVLWTREYSCPYQVSYAAGPRCTPVVAGDRVYTLGTMGDLYCFDLKDGKVIWSKKLPEVYQMSVPMWGFAGHPLIDGDRLICLVGGNGSVAVAFHKDTGKEIWKALSAEEPGYAPPMIYEFGGQRQLIIWHPESVNSLNPETGTVLWSHRFPPRGSVRAGMTIPTPRKVDDLLFCTCFYDGSLVLRISKDGKQATEVWRKKGRSEKPADTEALHAVMATPFILNNHIYGVCSYGELRCLDLMTGERRWATRVPTGNKELRWANAFLIQHEEKFFLFNEHGELILAHLSPKGYQEISRAKILAATNPNAGIRGMDGRLVLWSHPAFANRCLFVRNDREIVCVSLAAEDYQ